MKFRSVVGVDPSLTSTGIAVADPFGGSPFGGGARLQIETTRVRSKGAKNDSWETRHERLRALAEEITKNIAAASLVVIEGPSYGSISTSAHDRSGLWWFIVDACYAKGCTVVVVSPSQRMTYATGKGGGKDAGKDMVLAAVIKRYPTLNVTGNDVADAVIFMAMGLRMAGEPLEGTIPALNLRAMAKLPTFPRS